MGWFLFIGLRERVYLIILKRRILGVGVGGEGEYEILMLEEKCEINYRDQNNKRNEIKCRFCSLLGRNWGC